MIMWSNLQSLGIPWAFAKADLRSRYRGNKIGAAWFLLNPLLQTALFTFFLTLTTGELNPQYPIYIVTGVVLWEVITSSVLIGCGAFIYAEGYIKNFRINYDFYLMRVPFVVIFNFLINSIVLLIVVIIFNKEAIVNSLLSIIVALPFLFLLSYSLARVFAYTMLIIRDISQIMTHILQIVWYVSPIFIWKDFFNNKFSWLYEYNPITYYLELMRSSAIDNGFADLSYYGIVLAAAVVFYMIGALLSFKLKETLVFRI